MENQQLARQTISIKLLTVSKGEEIYYALNSDKKIRNLAGDDEPIKQALRYVFVLIGLKPEQFPTEIEKAVLIQFIFSNYSSLAVDEIKIAFELGVKGELNEPKLMEHFGNFSSMYFAKVIEAYKNYRNKVARIINDDRALEQARTRKEVSDKQKMKIQHEFDCTVVNPIFEKYKNTKALILDFTPSNMVYDTLIAIHQLKALTNDEKAVIKRQAKIDFAARKEQMSKGRPKNYQESKLKQSILAAMETDTEQGKQVLDMCYKKVICIVFDEMIAAGKGYLETLKEKYESK
jgi:hypothetical protein